MSSDIVDIKIPKFEPPVLKEWKDQTHEEKVGFFERNHAQFPALSRCNPISMAKEVREEGHENLANLLQKGADGFKCMVCGQTERPGFALSDDNLIFFCIDCSPEGWDMIWESELPEFKKIWEKLNATD